MSCMCVLRILQRYTPCPARTRAADHSPGTAGRRRTRGRTTLIQADPYGVT